MINADYTKVVSGVVVSCLLLNSNVIQAQVLEEIIVTAQRREQSMQEVPISLETMSGEDISKQGFRDMVQVSNFSTTF